MKYYPPCRSLVRTIALFFALGVVTVLNSCSVFAADSLRSADKSSSDGFKEKSDRSKTATVQESFIGLQPGLGSLPLLNRGRTRSISAENPTGEKGKGGMAIPNPSEPKPAASARAADDLGGGVHQRRAHGHR